MKMSFITVTLLYELVVTAITAFVVIIAFLKWRFSYWSRKGVPTLNPEIPFGDAKNLMTAKCTFSEQLREFYIKFKTKGVRHGGVFMGPKPFYIPVDPDIIKHIMQTDFQHFVNHGVYLNEKNDPLAAHLFNLEDAKWRNMRVKLTPTFTSGKMKMMFQTIADCGVDLKTIIDESANSHKPVDIKEILGRFTTDIIGSCAFGLECNSLKDPNALFRKYGKKIFEFTFWMRMKFIMQFSIPHNILRFFGMAITSSDVETFFMDAVKQTVEYREKNNIYRKDFLHLLLQLKNRGTVEDDGKIIDEDGSTKEKGLTMKQLAAQAFVFFGAGFETSSTTMTWALYELAINPDIQDKLRTEISTVLKKHQEEITYEAIMEMDYMDKVLYETLRKYPPVGVLPRKCNEDYRVPNTDVLIEKGTSIFIPAYGIHMDPEYYPNPEKFDPERFSEKNKSTRPGFTWLPFGDGPRICIGLRFGMLQSKVGLITLLKNFRIKLNKKTKIPLQFDKQSFITTAEGGIWIDIEKLE